MHTPSHHHGVVWSEQAEGALSTQEGITQSATGPCCQEGDSTRWHSLKAHRPHLTTTNWLFIRNGELFQEETRRVASRGPPGQKKPSFFFSCCCFHLAML